MFVYSLPFPYPRGEQPFLLKAAPGRAGPFATSQAKKFKVSSAGPRTRTLRLILSLSERVET